MSELVLADTDEAATLFLDAFENASKAAAMCAQAAEGMLGLLWDGFLMRPPQLEQAQRLAAANPSAGRQQDSCVAGAEQAASGASASAQAGVSLSCDCPGVVLLEYASQLLSDHTAIFGWIDLLSGLPVCAL